MASANLCVLPTQSNLSREPENVQVSEIDIDDPRFIEIQAREHSDHVKESNKDLSQIIDENTETIRKNVRVICSLNARKRKHHMGELSKSKRRKVLRVKRKAQSSEPSFLSCFVLGHPWMVQRHIHIHWKTINTQWVWA
ncbi:hypothetical protein PCASD_24640 [Puccinia coronata f. sp. avenae]|uniref:Uncharacterized protein n=1 Tax=Puccinia coronata f. sp. avenae TaxID=200324 RepID=A0A2N5S9S3_9BASI|nr:hypothetical protein PCASD_24640 [Puccinia coronata f. sp. avenae]